jgi:outer membrane biosynthesis protein TonB
MSTAIALRAYELPWSVSSLDSKRFRRILLVCIALMLFLGVAVPLIQLPQVVRDTSFEEPQTLTRIVLEKPVVVIPPPPPDRPLKNEPKPLPEKQPVMKPRQQQIVDKPIAQPTVADAREKAAVSGLLQFKDAFADMRDAVDVSKLNDTGSITRGSGDAATIDRSLLTSKHGTRSAGVNLAGLSRNTGGVALSGRATTKVDAPPGSVGQGGTRAGGGDGKSADDPRERSIEEIRRVFDSNKGAIFAIYNRALREDASLQGKVVLELKIDPTGHVLECRVVSSELADENLVAKIVSRIRMFDFGRKDVGTTTISYPVHFLPT